MKTVMKNVVLFSPDTFIFTCPCFLVWALFSFDTWQNCEGIEMKFILIVQLYNDLEIKEFE